MRHDGRTREGAGGNVRRSRVVRSALAGQGWERRRIRQDNRKMHREGR